MFCIYHRCPFAQMHYLTYASWSAMVPTTITSVFVLAPASLLRAAWSALIDAQPGLQVIGAAAEPPQIGTFDATWWPHVALLDEPAPIDMVQQCRQRLPTTGVLALVDGYQLSPILALLQAGAVGVLARDEPTSSLVRALVAVGRNELVLPAPIAVQALAAMASSPNTTVPTRANLSEREQEVLRLLARGATNKDIAQALFLSVRTIEAHMRSIFDKLGARSRTEAALWAVRHGYGLSE